MAEKTTMLFKRDKYLKKYRLKLRLTIWGYIISTLINDFLREMGLNELPRPQGRCILLHH